MDPMKGTSSPRPAVFPALVGGAILLALACGPTRAETIDLEVEVRARQLSPGEPVRIVVTSPEALTSLEGRFLGETVAMVRTGTDGQKGERWSGWAMVALDQAAGAAAAEMTGISADGRKALGRLDVTVQAKEFPTEELSVASKYVSPPPEVQERLARERARLADVYRMRTETPPPGRPFEKPVPGEPTSIFGTRRIFNGEPRSPHPGLDLRGGTGEPVAAAGPGTIVIAGDFYYSGNLVIVDHGGGLFTLYAHLSEIRVEEGQSVDQGEIVGLVGATGRVTGPHLHWGAKIGNRPFDPMALVDAELFR
jgi:murein DD-endopeptidase MepM/ murein hydrolase activator NlpD